MTVIALNSAERQLFKDVEHGDPTNLTGKKRKTISAEVLRHIVLGLPLVRKLRRSNAPCKKTGRGISITGATISGRLRLDLGFGEAGSPLCPIDFTDCVFDGGFSGAHGYFSRLSFKECRFIDHAQVDQTGNRLPTIDLTGAEIKRALDMRGIAPSSGASPILWIAASGLVLKGGLDLTGCILRAPDRSASGKRSPAETADPGTSPKAAKRHDALDLSLCDITGDLRLRRGADITGRFNLKSGRIGGDLWLRAASFAVPAAQQAILMQGTCIKGFLMMDGAEDADTHRSFTCSGSIKMNSADIGLALHLKGVLDGDLVAHDLKVGEDLEIKARVSGSVDLRDSTIGGTLELALDARSAEAEKNGEPVLTLENATVGRALRLLTEKDCAEDESQPRSDAQGAPARSEPRSFAVRGIVDLRGLTCGTLEDGIGTAWGKEARIRMNQFTYRQTGWEGEKGRHGKPGHVLFRHWLYAKWAETWWLPLPRRPLPMGVWEPWQLRRNWIYRHLGEPKADVAEDLRRGIREDEYRPHPLEQAIAVARAEGREDHATQFEMVKQRIEWRHFNRRVRWGLAVIAITLSALWLVISKPFGWVEAGATATACLLTIVLMIYGSALRALIRRRAASSLLRWPTYLDAALVFCLFAGFWVRWRSPLAPYIDLLLAAIVVIACIVAGSLMVSPFAAPEGRYHRAAWLMDKVSKLTMWAIYWLPASILMIVAGWIDTPFQFIIALLIFVIVRSTAVLAHQLMRFGFGYLRRPILAAFTLIVAFLIGWWGVSLARSRDMFVMAAEPVADSVARVPIGSSHQGKKEFADRMGSRRIAPPAAEMDVSCSHEISEPLYALDVLVPIVDLGEESRCEIRRFESPHRPVVPPDDKSFAGLWNSLWDLPLNDNRFWWWMKAVYAIAGWILVSLALLTFAQVNRTHGEPAE